MFPRSSSRFHPGQAVRLIRGGKAYFDLLEEMIHGAQSTIHIQVYIFDEDETGRKVANALIAAASRNVKIFILIDGYASQKISKEFIQGMRDKGIYFRRFEPLLKSKHFYFGRRLHHKVVVVDGGCALVGGLNISDRYNDIANVSAWLDWALYVEGSVAKELETLCNRRTRNRRFMRFKSPMKPESERPVHMGDSDVRVRINDWVNNKRQVSMTYLEMFRHASSHIIVMSPYFMPGNEFRRSMKKAIRRGVKIQVILAGVSDISISKNAERFVYRWLFKNNIEVFEYQLTVLHGKIAVCDGEWMTVGSYNLNDLSAQASVELNLDVNDKNFALDVRGKLQEIIKNDCVQITEGEFKTKTGLLTRAHQWLAYEVMRLLLFLFTFYFRQKHSK